MRTFEQVTNLDSYIIEGEIMLSKNVEINGDCLKSIESPAKRLETIIVSYEHLQELSHKIISFQCDSLTPEYIDVAYSTGKKHYFCQIKKVSVEPSGIAFVICESKDSAYEQSKSDRRVYIPFNCRPYVFTSGELGFRTYNEHVKVKWKSGCLESITESINFGSYEMLKLCRTYKILSRNINGDGTLPCRITERFEK